MQLSEHQQVSSSLKIKRNARNVQPTVLTTELPVALY